MAITRRCSYSLRVMCVCVCVWAKIIMDVMLNAHFGFIERKLTHTICQSIAREWLPNEWSLLPTNVYTVVRMELYPY